MAKQPKPVSRTKITTHPLIKIESFESFKPLPTAETVNRNVATLIGKENDFKTYGRPKKEKALGREPFTTAIHTDFIMMLKERALKRGCTVADLLDTVFKDHLHKY